MKIKSLIPVIAIWGVMTVTGIMYNLLAMELVYFVGSADFVRDCCYLYIFAGIVSSAVRIPWIELGAPFLSAWGFYESVLAVVLYCYLHYEEVKEEKRLQS